MVRRFVICNCALSIHIIDFWFITYAIFFITTKVQNFIDFCRSKHLSANMNSYDSWSKSETHKINNDNEVSGQIFHPQSLHSTQHLGYYIIWKPIQSLIWHQKLIITINSRCCAKVNKRIVWVKCWQILFYRQSCQGRCRSWSSCAFSKREVRRLATK